VLMTKLSIHSCDPPTDELARKRFDLDLRLELARYVLDGKIKIYDIKRLNHNTWSREWLDQESVDEFYAYFRELFPKYGGTFHYVEVKDI